MLRARPCLTHRIAFASLLVCSLACATAQAEITWDGRTWDSFDFIEPCSLELMFDDAKYRLLMDATCDPSCTKSPAPALDVASRFVNSLARAYVLRGAGCDDDAQESPPSATPSCVIERVRDAVVERRAQCAHDAVAALLSIRRAEPANSVVRLRLLRIASRPDNRTSALYLDPATASSAAAAVALSAVEEHFVSAFRDRRARRAWCAEEAFEAERRFWLGGGGGVDDGNGESDGEDGACPPRSHAPRFALIHIPNTGGTSVRYLFNAARGDDHAGQSLHFSVAHWTTCLTQALASRVAWFTVVRSPWGRALSSYHKLSRPAADPPRKAMAASAHAHLAARLQRALAAGSNDTFALFATDGGLAHAAETSMHFFPVMAFLRDDNAAVAVAPEHVIRYEELFAEGGAGIMALLRMLGLENNFAGRDLHSTVQPYTHGGYCAAYTTDAARAVAEVYADDITELGYEFECE